MRLIRLIACAGVAAVASAACSHYQDGGYPLGPTPGMLIGSGRVITETRPVTGFTSIAVSSAIQAFVSVGGADALDITTDDNILPVVDAVVAGGQLTIGLKPGTSGIQTQAGIICHIIVASLTHVSMSGGSRMQVDGVNARELLVEMSGASVFFGSGAADRLQMDLSGASRLTTSSLRARAVEATLTGASQALVQVVDALTVHATGASLLEYVGAPVVNADTSGLSIVRRVGG
jgi:hypothetical protein